MASVAHSSVARSATIAQVAPAVHRGALASALVLIAAGCVLTAATVSFKQTLLFAIGVGAGVVLYHAAFGFTSSWRDLIAHGRGGGLRAQMLMLGVTTAVFVPLIAQGSIFGQAVRGSVAPAGIPVIAGAFLFGVGMQLGGGCASGTLFSAGGGSVRMVATLAAFILGSVFGIRYAGIWDGAPALRPLSLVGELGPMPALIVSLAGFAAIWWISIAIERRRRGIVEADRAAGSWRALHGPWTLAAGALGLAVVNISTLLVAGRPWGVTAAFALWGSKALMAVGVDVASWP
ncbi:MAG: YeeE/YedE thiosulfate transporter family protein [Vicinamibacterales bacterium]